MKPRITAFSLEWILICLLILFCVVLSCGGEDGGPGTMADSTDERGRPSVLVNMTGDRKEPFCFCLAITPRLGKMMKGVHPTDAHPLSFVWEMALKRRSEARPDAS
jgi:hypothetical protein